MRKGWHVITGIALVCFLIGAVAIGVGFFTGSSPSALQAHGHLTEYGQRLSANWAILRQDLEVVRLGLIRLWQSLPF